MRWCSLEFTDTTFNQVARGANNESSDYAPQIYKIIGYKLSSSSPTPPEPLIPVTQIKTVTTTSGTNSIAFDAYYPYVWLKNMGSEDVYVSDNSQAQAGADDTALLKAGEIVRIVAQTDTVYVLGATTVEVYAQNFADCPFKVRSKGGGITVEPLSVTDNGTYTAPTGTAYSPVTVNVSPNVGTKSITDNGTYTASTDNLDGYSSVTVDTGIYTGATAPASALGKDGDYYYKRSNSFTAYELESPSYSTSSSTWIGFDFTLSTTISITKMSTYLTDTTNFKFCIGTENELVYESSEITGISGANELILPNPVELLPNVRYTAYIKMDSNKGQYFGQSRMVNFGKVLTFICGRYGTGTYRPNNTDNSCSYRVNFDYTTNDYHVKAEYHKKSGSWVEL
jgi:hypothetical protein